jgi:hypothetical protein
LGYSADSEPKCKRALVEHEVKPHGEDGTEIRNVLQDLLAEVRAVKEGHEISQAKLAAELKDNYKALQDSMHRRMDRMDSKQAALAEELKGPPRRSKGLVGDRNRGQSKKVSDVRVDHTVGKTLGESAKVDQKSVTIDKVQSTTAIVDHSVPVKPVVNLNPIESTSKFMSILEESLANQAKSFAVTLDKIQTSTAAPTVPANSVVDRRSCHSNCKRRLASESAIDRCIANNEMRCAKVQADWNAFLAKWGLADSRSW